MKVEKVIKITTIILLVAVISLASFFGIYKKDDYRVKNVVPDYKLGMEFNDTRVVNLEVDKEKNTAELLTNDNYKKTKSILKNRLKDLGVDQYRVVLDDNTGNMQIRIVENKDTDLVIYNLLQSGTFELKDSETKEVLIGTNNIKRADLAYSQSETENETAVYLQIKFDKQGQQKLEEISKTYVATIVEVANEEGEIEPKEETKNVTVCLNGEDIKETYFGSTITDGRLNMIVGTASDEETLQKHIKSAKESAAILNSGVLPINYIETDIIETSRITGEQVKIGVYVALGIVTLMILFFIIKLKTKGILASILQIGYIALLLLAVRYTNVKITFEGIAGILIATILNYIYIYISFKNIDLNFIKDITAKFALKLIPVCIIAIILSFNSIANIYSLGMTIVWGIIVMYLYNLTLTQITLKTIKK